MTCNFSKNFLNFFVAMSLRFLLTTLMYYISYVFTLWDCVNLYHLLKELSEQKVSVNRVNTFKPHFTFYQNCLKCFWKIVRLMSDDFLLFTHFIVFFIYSNNCTTETAVHKAPRACIGRAQEKK